MLFFFKQKTAYEMRISDWSSDVCSSDLDMAALGVNGALLILLPVLVTECCAILVERAQPRNLFVYIFCSGFLAAALSALACLLLGLGLLWHDEIGRASCRERVCQYV